MTCEHCQSEYPAPAGSWKAAQRRFCSPDCAWDAHRGSTHPPWKRGTSEALARSIARLLLTDRGAQDRFNRLLGRPIF